jgi:hypothetical protein
MGHDHILLPDGFGTLQTTASAIYTNIYIHKHIHIGQNEAPHRKYKRLKLGGGHVYDCSSV